MPNKKDKDYILSVRLMTFMHEPYIKEAMDGIMMQETTFKVEVVVGDDFSTDGTLDIIKSYSDTENIHIKILKREKGDDYWQKRHKLGRLYNFINIIENCTGKYIALLDGDDYWTDPLKLQKQVDYLESKPDYGLLFTDCSILYEHSNKIEKSNKNLIHCDELSNTQLFNKIIKGDLQISTPTIVIRKKLLDIHDFNSNKFMMGDMPLLLDYAMNCKFHYCQHDTTVYRNRINSASHPKDEIKKIRFKENAWEMKVYYSKKYANDIADWAQNQLNKHRIEMKAMFPKENIRLNNPILKHSLLFALIAVTPIKKYLLFRILRKVGLF